MKKLVGIFFILGLFLGMLVPKVNETLFSTTIPEELLPIEIEIENPVEKVEEHKPIKTTISLVGDILMDGSVRTQIDKNGVEYPLDKVKNYFLDDHVTIGNLETSITYREEKWPEKKFNFKSDSKNLKAMKDSGIDIVTLANNHSLDYGYDGFIDTLNYIDKHELKRAGGGKNKEEALAGTIVEVNNIKIGVLSFSRVVPTVDWYATTKRPGIVGAYDGHIKEVIEQINIMKENTDLIVVSIHWGVEGSNHPRVEEINLAKKLIDNGADIIMGHHPHVLQGIEIYNSKPIFYSLGNFIFTSKGENARNTVIAQVNLIDKEIDNIKLIPTTIVNGQPIPNENITESIKFLNIISKDFNTKIDEQGIIKIKR